MALQAELFRGDSKLEAAAVSDAAHILPGATGPHVGKIQFALIELDDAAVDQDSIYGPKTAAAVLRFKQKRNIVNRATQKQADNIVGKMTMAALDREMLLKERLNTGSLRIVPLFPRGQSPVQPRDLAFGSSQRVVFGVGPSLPVTAPGSPIPQIQLRTNQLGKIVVANGVGKRLVVRQSINGLIFDPNKPEESQAGSVAVTQNPQILHIRARDRGRTEIVVIGTSANPTGQVGMLLSVVPNVFTEVKTFFHFLDGPPGIKTARKPGDLDAILKTMNAIYGDQAGMQFANSGVNPSLTVRGLGDRVKGVRASQFGSTPDTIAIKANRKAEIMFNVFFFDRFITTPNSDGSVPDFLALTSRPPNDDKPLRCCLCRDPQKGDPAGNDPGKTLAHEAGHALGEDDDEERTDSLMFFTQSAQTDTKISFAMARRMLISFKQFPP